MLRSHGLGRPMNPRRSPLTSGTAVIAAFAAALIGLPNAPAARADTEPDPFEDLFGTAGNSWTASADSSLLSSDPTLAASLDTSVDNFLASVIPSPNFPEGDDPFSFLVWSLDPSAFSPDSFYGPLVPVLDNNGLPDNAIGDFAVGLDYALFASGIGGNDVGITDLLSPILSIPAYIEGLPVLLGLLFAGL
jgi:hypothetical protein